MLQSATFLHMVNDAQSLLRTMNESNVFADLISRFSTGHYRDNDLKKSDVESVISHVKMLNEIAHDEDPRGVEQWAKNQMKSPLWVLMKEDGLTMDQSVGLYVQGLRDFNLEVSEEQIAAIRDVASEVHFDGSTPSGAKPAEKKPAQEAEDKETMVSIVFEGDFSTGKYPHVGMIQGYAHDLGGAHRGGDLGAKRISLEFSFDSKEIADQFAEIIGKKYAEFTPKISYFDVNETALTEDEMYKELYDALNDAVHNFGWVITDQKDDEIVVKTDDGKPVSEQSIQHAKEISDQFGLVLDASRPEDGDVVFILPELDETTTAAMVAATAIPMPFKRLSDKEKDDVKKGKYKGEPVGKYMRLLKKRMAQGKTQSKPYGA